MHAYRLSSLLTLQQENRRANSRRSVEDGGEATGAAGTGLGASEVAAEVAFERKWVHEPPRFRRAELARELRGIPRSYSELARELLGSPRSDSELAREHLGIPRSYSELARELQGIPRSYSELARFTQLSGLNMAEEKLPTRRELRPSDPLKSKHCL